MVIKEIKILYLKIYKIAISTYSKLAYKYLANVMINAGVMYG